MNRLAIALGLLSALLSVPIHAGSIIRTELASIEDVRLVVSSGGLSYRPLPRLDREVLDGKITGLIVAHLRTGPIKLVSESRQTLIVSIKKAWRESDSSELVAIMVSLSLTEPVTTRRQVTWLGRDDMRATTWEWSIVDVVPMEQVQSEILAWVEQGVENLTSEIAQAREYLKD